MLPRTIKVTVKIKGGLALARPVRGGKHDGILVIENEKPKMTGPMVEAKKGFSPIENTKSLTKNSPTPPNSKTPLKAR
jgi:hypothetical protein